MADEGGVLPEAEPVDFERCAKAFGRWELAKDVARYVGPSPATEPDGQQLNFGILVTPTLMAAGKMSASLRFPPSEEPEPQGRLVFGLDVESFNNYSAGLGGYESLYVVEQLARDAGGWRLVRGGGHSAGLERGVDYDVTVTVTGTAVRLEVNGVLVQDVSLPGALVGYQTGLTAWGTGPVEFRDLVIETVRPEVFVVMKFGDPYDSLYREVIAPVTSEAGFEPVRGDDILGPGVIIDDITQAIHRADVVIAEITPINANVYYELGYAHALGKPTILLSKVGEEPPFDVSGWRRIRYEDSIGGRRHVEEELTRHLEKLFE